MGLKKLFSHRENKESKDLKTYDSRNESKASPRSLSKVLSGSWTHKDKEKTKRQSFGRLNNSSTTSADTPAAAAVTHRTESSITSFTPLSKQQEHLPVKESTAPSTPLNDTIDVTPSPNKRHSSNTNNSSSSNPFLITNNNNRNSMPISPTDSMRDVNDVVNVLRNSASSQASSSIDTVTTNTTLEETSYKSHEITDMNETNPFKMSVAPIVISEEPCKVLGPTVMSDGRVDKISMDEAKDTQSGPTFITTTTCPNTTPDFATSTNKENEDVLYAELLTIEQQLNAINPNNAIEVKTKLLQLGQLIINAADKSSRLQPRIKEITELSKQHIKTLSEENTTLKKTAEKLKDQHALLSADHQSTVDENTQLEETLAKIETEHKEIVEKKETACQNLNRQYEILLNQEADLRTLNEDLTHENNELKTSHANLLSKNSQHEEERRNVCTLLNIGEGKDRESLQSKLKTVLAAAAASSALAFELQKKTRAMEVQHQNEMDTTRTNLIQQRDQELGVLKTDLTSQNQLKIDTLKADLKNQHEEELTKLKEEEVASHEQAMTELYNTLKAEHEQQLSELKEIQAAHDEKEFKKQSERTDMDIQKSVEETEKKYIALLAEKDTTLTAQVTLAEQSILETAERRISEIESQHKKECNELKEKADKIDRLQHEIDLLRSSTTDTGMEDIMRKNLAMNDEITGLTCQLQQSREEINQQIDKQHAKEEQYASAIAAATIEIASIKEALASTTESSTALQAKMDEIQGQLLETQHTKDSIITKHATSHQQLSDELEAAKTENTRLLQALKDTEITSIQSAQVVMDENERLENRIRQIEEGSSLNMQENVVLNEEVELLSKNTTKRALVDENQRLKNELKAMNNLRKENTSLSELVECLQTKMKEPMMMQDRIPTPDSSNSQDQQEQLLSIHTRAQLGLIEYLEGEKDVMQAMSRFKRQLEEEIRDLDPKA